MFFTFLLLFDRFTKVQKKHVPFEGYHTVKVLSQAHGGIEQLLLYHR